MNTSHTTQNSSDWREDDRRDIERREQEWS